jgi:hypothetical protein
LKLLAARLEADGIVSARAVAACTDTTVRGVSKNSDAAFLELLSSYEAAIAAASFAPETARALADAHRKGEHPSAYTLEQTTSRLERQAADLEKLRANVATLKAMFGVH